MAIGDRIGSARTAGFMRRINALEDHPVLASPLDGISSFAITARKDNNNMYIGDNITSGSVGYRFNNRSAPTQRLEDFPGAKASFPDEIAYFEDTLYTSYSATEMFKYNIGSDSWGSASTPSSEFLKYMYSAGASIRSFRVYPNSGKMFHRKHTVSSGGRPSDTILGFDDDGSLVQTITLGDDGSGDILGSECVGFAFDGSDILTIHTSSAVGSFIIAKYTSSGVVISGSFGGSDYITTTLSPTVASYLCQVFKHLVSGNIIAQVNNTFGSYSASGSVNFEGSLAANSSRELSVFSDIFIVDTFVNGAAGNTARVNIYDKDLVFVRSFILNHHDASTATQKEFFSYPTPASDTGKVSLGTPDAGLSIPANTALQGLRPHYLELRDMRTAIESVATGYENPATSSAYTTSAGVNNIFHVAIDSGQDDWTTATVTHKDRIREDYYNDIALVLTQLEQSALV